MPGEDERVTEGIRVENSSSALLMLSDGSAVMFLGFGYRELNRVEFVISVLQLVTAVVSHLEIQDMWIQTWLSLRTHRGIYIY